MKEEHIWRGEWDLKVPDLRARNNSTSFESESSSLSSSSLLSFRAYCKRTRETKVHEEEKKKIQYALYGDPL
jgi:hypothetical protein